MSVSRTRLQDGSGPTSEWRSRVLGRYQRRIQRVEALITSADLAGTHTRQV